MSALRGRYPNRRAVSAQHTCRAEIRAIVRGYVVVGVVGRDEEEVHRVGPGRTKDHMESVVTPTLRESRACTFHPTVASIPCVLAILIDNSRRRGRCGMVRDGSAGRAGPEVLQARTRRRIWRGCAGCLWLVCAVHMIVLPFGGREGGD